MKGFLNIVSASLLFVLVVCQPHAEAGLGVPSGYVQANVLSVSSEEFLGGMDYLSNGSLVYFDGTVVRRYSGTAPGDSLYDPPGMVWGSFLNVVNDTTIYFGESADMHIYQIYSGGGGSQVATVQYNFDLEHYGSELYVSYNPSTAPPPGAPEAQVAKITLPGGTLDTILGDTGGYTGPVTFDSDGNMYYCMPNQNFGQPGVAGLYFFTRAQVQSAFGAGELDLSDGNFLGDDLTGCYDMEYDSQAGRIFVTTGNDLSAQIQVYDVGTGNVSVFATKTSGSFWSTYLRFRPGTKPFTPYNGPNAGVLSVVQNQTIYEITPDQPSEPWAAASTVDLAMPGGDTLCRSEALNAVSLLLIPAAAILLWTLRIRRNKTNG